MKTYLGWNELNDDEPLAASHESLDPASGWESLEQLMKERAELEQRLLRLLGKAPPKPADARELARFPMPIHTAESRMADRRAARDEERARAGARRSIERLRLREREVHERIEQKRHAEAAALAAEAQRDADARREDERRQDRMRTLLVEALIRASWDEQRAAALEASKEAKRKEWSDFADKYARCHERARCQVTQRRAADKALAERLDSRRRSKADDAFDRSRRGERNV